MSNMIKIIATNKKAYFDYFVISTFEAGIMLEGCEVKSVRNGNTNLKDCFVLFTNKNEMFVKNMYIKKFEQATNVEIDEKRDRKLLLNKSEILKCISKIKEKGFTCVPLKIYLSGQKVKLEIGLVKGKHTYDKKEVLKEKDLKREEQIILKSVKQK